MGQWSLSISSFTGILPQLNPHEVTLEDTIWFYLKEPDPIKFLMLDRWNQVRTLGHNLAVESTFTLKPLTFDIHLSESTTQYRRRVLTIFEVTGFLGGIFEIFEISVGILLGTFSYFAFKSNLENEIIKANIKYEQTLEEIRKMKDDFSSNRLQREGLSKEDEKEEEIKSLRQKQSKFRTDRFTHMMEEIRKITDTPMEII